MPLKRAVSWNSIWGTYHIAGHMEYPEDMKGMYDTSSLNMTWCPGSWLMKFFGKNQNNTHSMGLHKGGTYYGQFGSEQAQFNYVTVYSPGSRSFKEVCQVCHPTGMSFNMHLSTIPNFSGTQGITGPCEFFPAQFTTATPGFGEPEDPNLMGGISFQSISGGGEDDERIWGLPRGCKKHLECPEWAWSGEVFSIGSQGGTNHFNRIGYEDVETFYAANQVHLTTGATDLVGEIIQSGQASGRRILSHTGCTQDNPLYAYRTGTKYTIGGAEHSGLTYVIDTAPGREDNILQPNYMGSSYDIQNKLTTPALDKNNFNMLPFGNEGVNSFFLNLTWYLRPDPWGTYSGVYQNINNSDPDTKYYHENLVDKYVVKKVNMATRETKLYTWIPYLAKATGFMGGYLWHTIKQLAHTGIHPKDQANDFHIRHSYRDIGVNKDGIGNFFNFTGESGNLCYVPGQPLTPVIQHASGLVYTGQGIEYTGGVNHYWNRQNFASGDFSAYLDNITNINTPEGTLAPSTGVVDTIARFFERIEPTGIYSGHLNWPVCQDPLIARPAALKIIHEPTHRGTSHAALFIEPVNYNNEAWDFDYTGFQMGDGRIGVHKEISAGRSTNNLSATGEGHWGYWRARTRGQAGNSLNNVFPQTVIGPSGVWSVASGTSAGHGVTGTTDGWYPISHFYHHNTVDQQEFEDIYTYAPTKNWYENITGSFDEIHHLHDSSSPITWPANYFIPGPFENYVSYGGGSTRGTSFDSTRDQVSYYTYIPIEGTFHSGKRGVGLKNYDYNVYDENIPQKACGHRFMSGFRTIGRLKKDDRGRLIKSETEQATEILGYTRSRRTVPTGGIGHTDYDSTYSLPGGSFQPMAIETGEIIHPRIQLSQPWGDLYSFHISGWANYCFPQHGDIQYITGFQYACTQVELIRPRMKPWFCPKKKDSLNAANQSLTQEVRFGNRYNKVGSCITEPPIYKYKINIERDHWGNVDATPGSHGPHLTFYDDKYNDIKYGHTGMGGFMITGNVGLLPSGFTYGTYELSCGDVIASVMYYGKFTDGASSEGLYSTADPTVTTSYWNNIGDKGGQDLVYWTTGMGGYHNTNGGCPAHVPQTNVEPGLAALRGETPPLSEYSRFDCKACGSRASMNIITGFTGVFPSGYHNDIWVHHVRGSRSFFGASHLGMQAYPYEAVQLGRPLPERSKYNEINIRLTHPNRGMVHFDCGEMRVTGNNSAGMNFSGYLGEKCITGYTVPASMIGGSSSNTYSFPMIRNMAFVRTWEIEPTNKCHDKQTFSVPYLYVWQESAGSSWQEPSEVDYGAGPQVYGGWLETQDDGTMKGHSWDSKMNRIQVHTVNNFFCPVVFENSSGAINSLLSSDQSAEQYPDPGDASYTCNAYQMPFARRTPLIGQNNYWSSVGAGSADQLKNYGSRRCQQWPVIVDWANYGNFEPTGGAGGVTSVHAHKWNGSEGMFKGRLRHYKDDVIGEQPFLGTKNPIFNINSNYTDFGFSYPNKDGWSAGPNNYNHMASNYCLRLLTGTAYNVREYSYYHIYLPYFLEAANSWVGLYARAFETGIFDDRVGHFQTNGTYYLSNTYADSFGGQTEEQSLSGNLQNMMTKRQGHDPQQSGYISYQTALDKWICTFNVRGNDPTPGMTTSYISPARKSYNCQGGGTPIMLPARPTIAGTNHRNPGSCVTKTATVNMSTGAIEFWSGFEYLSCLQNLNPSKSVLMPQQAGGGSPPSFGGSSPFAAKSTTSTTDLGWLVSDVVYKNWFAASKGDAGYLERSYGYNGVSEIYTTLELGHSNGPGPIGVSGELSTGEWYSYGKSKGGIAVY